MKKAEIITEIETIALDRSNTTRDRINALKLLLENSSSAHDETQPNEFREFIREVVATPIKMD